ncbi:hypothetical protein JCM15765_18560 [Paradesulfitobacterium aromaticivorans]
MYGFYAGSFAAKPLFDYCIIRYIVGKQISDVVGRLLSDKYTQNLMEVFPAGKRISVLNILEIGLRAENEKIITRPLGTPKHFPGFYKLKFAPRLMTALSLKENTPLNMQVTIGPKPKSRSLSISPL